MNVYVLTLAVALIGIGPFGKAHAAQGICETTFSAGNVPSLYRPGRAIRALQSIDPNQLVVHTPTSAWLKDLDRRLNLITALSGLIRGDGATLLSFEDSLDATQMGSDFWIEKIRKLLEIDVLPHVTLEDYSRYHLLRMAPHYIAAGLSAAFGFSLWNQPMPGDIVAHGLYVGGSLMAATTGGTAGFFLSSTFVDTRQARRMDSFSVDRPSLLAQTHLSETGQAYFILIPYQTRAGAQHTLVLGYGLQPNTVTFGSRFKNTEPYFFAVDAALPIDY